MFLFANIFALSETGNGTFFEIALLKIYNRVIGVGGLIFQVDFWFFANLMAYK